MAILCGGRGTRLQEHTQSIPKPMVEIGGRPILWHVIQIYLAQGFRRFLLLTGYRGEQIRQFVDARGLARRRPRSAAWTPAPTHRPAAALHLAAAELDGADFCLTYADGVADVDLEALLAYHAGHGAVGHDDGRPPRAPVRRGRARRRRRRQRLRREASQRALDQRRLLLLRAGMLELLAPTRCSSASRSATGRRRRAAGLPPRGLLGLHGHLQGRGGCSTICGDQGEAPWKLWS